ncbi:MAG: NAD(P)H-dependent oxidoreductase subunit E [Deltaproteobacteria bacterium]|nr:NAD(P)H-dependent oxidoreductase subunit E [Deltaproteobacteria bacterium]
MCAESLGQELSATLKKWKNKRGNLIMILHEIQDRYGYVPRDVALEVAKELDIPLAQIWEVLTFYNLFKLEAPGKYVISVCMGTACYLKGAPEVFDKFKEELGVDEGESTKDKMFHLQGVRCLGCCGLAPAVTINGKIYSKLKPHDVAGIIVQCREQDKLKNLN